MQLTREWDKVLPQSNKVEHHKITSRNRYGIMLVGNLYMPKNIRSGQKPPAIAVAGASGAVKEQSGGLYAREMAERGFVTLAFDPSYLGESDGEPRNMASPGISTKDFSAAVDFPGPQNLVNCEQISISGICGWGGMALNAAVGDTCIKTVATSTMYDMARVVANGYEVNMRQNARGGYDRTQSQIAEVRHQMKVQPNNGRWEAARSGYATLSPANNLDPKDITADTPKFIAEYTDFYRTKCDFHPRAVNSSPQGSWATTVPLVFIGIPILQRTSKLRASALIVYGEKAYSRYFSEDAFKSLGSKNKELYIVPGANHTDLYDNTRGKTPSDKLSSSLKQIRIKVV